MPNLPTFDDLLNQGQGETQARNPELTDYEKGSNLDAVNGGQAMQADEVIGVLVQLFGALFFETADDAELDTLILDRYGTALARKVATPSIGTLTFSTTAALVPSGTRVEAVADGEAVTVQTDANATKVAGPGTVDVAATAIQDGRQGNIAAGTATTLIDAIPGDASATVTNAERFAGGSDEESNDELLARAKDFFQTLRRGTQAALRTGALTVDGVSFVTVDESTLSTLGYVSVYVGDPDGAGNTALADAVDAVMVEWRAAGVQVEVFAAAREEIALAMTVTIQQGANRSTLHKLIEAAVLVGYMDSLASAETWYASKVESQAHGVNKTLVRGVEVTSPATRTKDPTAAQNALRTLSSALSISWVEES